MITKQTAIERTVAGYSELIHTVSAAHPLEFPDPGVTMAQMRVLMVLGVRGETRMSDMAPQLGISLSTLSSLVDRLVEAELVARRTDPHDRRSVLVSMAARGTELLESFHELGADQLRKLLAHLSDSELDTVNQAVDALINAARRMTTEDPS